MEIINKSWGRIASLKGNSTAQTGPQSEHIQYEFCFVNLYIVISKYDFTELTHKYWLFPLFSFYPIQASFKMITKISMKEINNHLHF